MKNKILLLMIVGQLALIAGVEAQSIAINTTGATADVSAILDISSTTKGLLIPRVNAAQFTTISAAAAVPANGLMVYNTATNALNINTGTTTVPSFLPLLSSITATTPLTYASGTVAIPVATTSVNGYLAATDWAIFNAKQTALNTGVGFVKANGTSVTFDPSTYIATTVGTVNYLPKYTAASTIGNSIILDNGTNVGINIALPTSTLHINGSMATAVSTVVTTTGTSISSAYNLILVNITGTAGTIILPTTSGIGGRMYTIKNITAGTTITLTAATGQNIDAANTLPLASVTGTLKFVTIQTDGTNWYIIANN